MKISKELFNEIMGNVSDIYNMKVVNDYLFWDNGYSNQINIYELEYKGKQWANNKGFRIIEIDTDLFWVIHKKYNISYRFNYGMISSTHSTFFEACQWILDNKA